MEKYNAPFFGTEGLTSTSANHISNLAKEYSQSLEAELNATSFVEQSIAIVGSMDKTVSDKGTPEILDNCSNHIDNIVAAKALIAWLREGIKMKEKYSKDLDFYVSDENAAFNEILKQGGFDIKKYSGILAQKYSYVINDKGDTLNLIANNGEILGGYFYDNVNFEYSALFNGFGE